MDVDMNTDTDIVFFGDDQYSLTALKEIHPQTNIKCVVTAPPRPKGRKQIITPSPVEEFATHNNIKTIHYTKQHISTVQQEIENIITSNTYGVLASFGYIIPKQILNTFNNGIINIHPSLLPQYKGATPVQHAIALGDSVTGVTLFKITPKIDDGEIISQTQQTIQPDDTTSSLTTRLFKLGANNLIDHLTNHAITNGTAKPSSTTTSPKNLIYTKRFTRDTGFIPWHNFIKMLNDETIDPEDIQNPLLQLRIKHNNINDKISNSKKWISDMVRALNPWPSVWTKHNINGQTKRIKLTKTNPLMVHIEGKPKPIKWEDFKKYYTNNR